MEAGTNPSPCRLLQIRTPVKSTQARPIHTSSIWERICGSYVLQTSAKKGLPDTPLQSLWELEEGLFSFNLFETSLNCSHMRKDKTKKKIFPVCKTEKKNIQVNLLVSQMEKKISFFQKYLFRKKKSQYFSSLSVKPSGRNKKKKTIFRMIYFSCIV